MSFKERVFEKARQNVRTIVLPEGDERRTILAAQQLAAEGIARPVLIGDPSSIADAAGKAGASLTGVGIVDPADSPKREEYAGVLYELRKAKGMSEEEAGRLIADPMYFGVMMVRQGDGDGLVSGAVHTTGDMLRPALKIIKTRPGIKVVSSSLLMDFQDKDIGHDGLMVFSDCVVIPCPSDEELAHIAISAADTARTLCGIEDPKVALLSFSTKGSAEHELVSKVRSAVRIARSLDPALALDGELQLDAAIVPEVAALKAGGSPVAGKANVLIFPDLQSGNIGYKIAQRMGHAQAYAVLQGLARPCNDLSRGCSVGDIVMTAALTALQAAGSIKQP